MNDYDHGHAWDARYNKSESKSETIGTVFSEKEIHNATIDAIVLELEKMANELEASREDYIENNCGDAARCYRLKKVGVNMSILKIKSMKQG